MFVDPLINVVAPRNASASTKAKAHANQAAQFEAWDMLTGRTHPELGGSEDVVDLVGVNYYSENQWYYDGDPIPPGHADYVPLASLLARMHERYAKPLFIAETGAEGDKRASWLGYVGDEVMHALNAGTPVAGVCLYPVLDYPGWINDRHCETGLFGFADENGVRSVHRGLASQLAFQQARFESLRSNPTAEAVVT